MTSFFSFSSSSSTPKLASKTDDTQLEITVTPAQAAFYAGETFSVTVTFICSRKTPLHPSGAVPQTPVSSDGFRTPTSAARAPLDLQLHPGLSGLADGLPARRKQVGLSIDTSPEAYNAEAGPSRHTTPLAVGGYTDSPVGLGVSPYSPGADPSRAGWPTSGSPIRDGMAGVRSPEEGRRYGVRGGERRTQSLALTKGMSPQEMVWALGGQPTPPLPSRRPPGSAHIPSHHPHSRKISVASTPQAASPPASVVDLSETHLQSIPEYTSHTGDGVSRSRPQISRMASSASSTSSATHSHVDIVDETPRYRPNNHRPTPATLSPPPTHPYIRSLAEPRETTILWAHTRLVAHFQPSNTYIPPDPLLPLRSLLLHQPIGAGSGSLTSSTSTTAGSRWQLSFGTGTIGHETKPSLTGSLVGLASSIVYGGSAGSLEEERKKAWNTKDLPVLETARSLLGVDIKLKEGEKREFVYTFPIPSGLPPTHRGRAFKFGWDFVLSLAVAEGGGKGQMRSREIEVPIRVWNHIALGSPPAPYNVLSPVIQTQDQGSAKEVTGSSTTQPAGATASPTLPRAGDNLASLESYARHLLETVSTPSPSGIIPRSPSAHRIPRARSPSGHHEAESEYTPRLPSMGQLSVAEGTIGRKTGRGRKGSFIKGDEVLVDEGGDGDGCDQAVEILSRHSTKASYDIAKDGDLVSVLTLLKTTYRLGETILGVISINPPPQPSRHVLKFSAYLESNDLIPTPLLPPSPRGGLSAQPALVRTHADLSAGYINQTGRLAFNLDIPSDATPGFAFRAGEEGTGEGGVEWRIRLAFLVATPARGSAAMIMSAKEGDNRFYTAAGSLAPVIQMGSVGGGKTEIGGDLVEMPTETVECEIPIKVLPGHNAAVRVRPMSYTL